jgi:hypothetical protein
VLDLLYFHSMTQPATRPRELNVVALLAFIVGLGLAGLDLWVVEISSTPDTPIIGLLLTLLPGLTAILWVYPTVSWFYRHGAKWPSEVSDVRAEIQELRSEIVRLRERLER